MELQRLNQLSKTCLLYSFTYKIIMENKIYFYTALKVSLTSILYTWQFIFLSIYILFTYSSYLFFMYIDKR
jgi:hypothetical protein